MWGAGIQGMGNILEKKKNTLAMSQDIKETGCLQDLWYSSTKLKCFEEISNL